MDILKLAQTFFFTVVFSISITSCAAQKEIRSHLEQVFDDRYLVADAGAAVLVSKDGNAIFQKYYGQSNIELNIPITGTTRFSIGSLTKQFTAAAILMLEDEGELSTEDFLGQYLEDYNQKDYPVKISHLLTHTSGLPGDNADKDISKNLRNHLSAEDILKYLINTPLKFYPGSKYSYSNTGYIFLGLIIEKVTGMSYKDYLKKNVFDVLGLKNTSVGYFQDIIDNRASGYDNDLDGNLINATYHSSSHAAGAIISTANDLATWTEALFGGKVLSEAGLAAMLVNRALNDGTKLNNGYGWELNLIHDYTSFEHSGYEPGYKCYTIYIREEGIHVVVLQNIEVGTPSTVSIRAAAIASGNPYMEVENAIDLDAEQMKALSGKYAFEGNNERIIGNAGNQLFIKTPGGRKRRLYALNDHTLFLENGYNQLRFSKNSNEGFRDLVISNRIKIIRGSKVSADFELEHAVAEIAPKELSRYEGIYKSENIELNISLDNGSLFAQPPGSEKLRLIPKSGNQFFIKEIGAELEFTTQVVEGKIKEVVLILLEGNKMKAIKE